MLAFMLSTVAATVVPWIVFSEKDKSTPGGYTLGRVACFAWMMGTFVLAVVFGGIGMAISGDPAGIHVGWAFGLMYVATRRLRDMNASPWFALFGLLWPLAFFGHVVLCFIPGADRQREV